MYLKVFSLKRRESMSKILLLEDDALFSESLEDFLTDEGFIVDIACDGLEALDKNFESNYDLYLLDINVPKLNGLELLKELRLSGDNTPSIFLTSYKDKETLQKGFECGVDDYIVKPLDLDELLLRVRALLKRSGKQIYNVQLTRDLLYNPNLKRLLNNDVDLQIPAKVIDLLELCLANRGSIINKEMIVQKLWNTNEEHSEGSIRVYINNLKKILGKDAIVNIKGIGYKVEF